MWGQMSMKNKNKLVKDLQYCISKYFNGLNFDEYNEKLFADISDDNFMQKLEVLCTSLQKSVDFANPMYLAHMVVVPTPYSLLAFYLGSLMNQNQHAFESSPSTTNMEFETIMSICKLFEYPENSWGHFTSGGTLANLEAAWLTRKKYGNKLKILFASTAHISWKRICDITNVDYKIINVNQNFQIDLNHLLNEINIAKNNKENLLVVASLGTTGCGAIDPIDEICEMKKEYNFSLHIDAAWGGFFKVLETDNILDIDVKKKFKAIKEADSITVDPHKQGYIPYGCGTVIYRDSSLRNEILHNAPYTFTLNNNLGQISLEGSRNGAYAASCWLNFQVLPLTNSGMGKIYRRLLEQTIYFKRLIIQNGFKLLTEPEMNIICFYPEGKSLSEINEKSQRVIDACSIKNSNKGYPVLSKYTTDDNNFISRIGYELDENSITSIRCVISKLYWDEAEWKSICARVMERIKLLLQE